VILSPRKAKTITNHVLKRMLRTYWGDNYNGVPIASDELGRLAADRITKLEKELKDLRTYHAGVERVRQATSGTRWDH